MSIIFILVFYVIFGALNKNTIQRKYRVFSFVPLLGKDTAEIHAHT